MHVLLWMLVGLIAGWATGRIMDGRGRGSVLDAIIGLWGAVSFGYIVGSIGFLCLCRWLEAILVAIGGASMLTFVVRKLMSQLRPSHQRVGD